MADSTGNFSLSSVEKLRGRENYVTWKFQITNLLKYEGLWQLVKSEISGNASGQSPGSGSNQAPAAELQSDLSARRDEKALSRINLTLDKSVFPYVMQATSAREAWKALAAAFEDDGLSRWVSLLRRLCCMKLERFQSVEAYINEAKFVSEQLSAINQPIPDKLLAGMILQGLTPDYDPMIMDLTSSGKEITSDYIRTLLLQDGTKWSRKSRNETALVTGNRNNWQKKSKFVPTCYVCDQKGHYSNSQDYPAKQNVSHSRREQPFRPQNPRKGRNGALVAALSARLSTDDWVVDSGCSQHMSGCRDWFRTFNSSQAGLEITLGNNHKLVSEGCGDVEVTFQSGIRKIISNVLYVPHLRTNLLSVDVLISKDYSVTFDVDGCKIYEIESVSVKAAPMLSAPRGDGVFKLKTTSFVANSAEIQRKSPNATEMVWHQRLAHLNHFSMKLLRDGLATGIFYTPEKNLKLCEPCIRAKHSRNPFPKEKTKLAEKKLALVHTDLCGPFQVESWSGARYMLTFLDDHTRKLWVYFLNSKDETAASLMEFVKMAETQSGHKVKTIRSDNGSEFVNRTLQKFFKEKGEFIREPA
ncbi:unnamed protein product [Nesidiocoris tenuis]|uniref:Integrase catalytic domain-containing protein n=1 Tax=Nesidiocoris tenuis TaxID=355587 RepID=A0A6H5GVQ0_9HEMI|nr:unnamed protein product [Nesidiocoris tenuis]CAB0007372.1 unnamed protein product [Nesidiocoris tenuis]